MSRFGREERTGERVDPHLNGLSLSVEGVSPSFGVRYALQEDGSLFKGFRWVAGDVAVARIEVGDLLVGEAVEVGHLLAPTRSGGAVELDGFFRATHLAHDSRYRVWSSGPDEDLRRILNGKRPIRGSFVHLLGLPCQV